MALKKTVKEKNVDLEYHMIVTANYSKFEDRTALQVGVYKNKVSADESIYNYLRLDNYAFTGGDYSLDDLYTKLKESKKVEQLDKPAEPAVIEDGEVVTPAKAATYKQVETNVLVDALDV